MCVQQCCVLPLNIIYLNFFSRVFSGVLIFFFNLYLLCYFWLKSSFTLFLDTFATLKRIQSGFFFSLWRTTCWKKMDITKKKKRNPDSSVEFCSQTDSDIITDICPLSTYFFLIMDERCSLRTKISDQAGNDSSFSLFSLQPDKKTASLLPLFTKNYKDKRWNCE